MKLLTNSNKGIMDIKVLGSNCQKCKSLEMLTREVISEMGIDATITKEEDIMKIMGYGALSTPGLVINEKVAISGRIPSKKELVELISTYK